MQLPSNERIFNRNSQTWIKWGIILAILGASAYAYRLAERFPIVYLAMGIGAVIIGLAALRNMPLMLTGVVLLAAPIGITFDTGTATPLPLAMLAIVGLTAVWLVKMLLFDKHVYLKPSPLNFPLLVFLISLIVSWIVGEILFPWRLAGITPGRIVQVGQYALFALSFAALFLVAHQPLRDIDLQRWAWIIILLGIGEIAYELITQSYDLRERGITGAIYIFSIVLLGAQLLFNPNLKRWMYIAGTAGLLIWGYWAYINLAWKGGWLPALLGLAMLFALKARRWFWLLLIVLVGLVVLQWNDIVGLIYEPELGTSSNLRIWFWYDVIRMTSRSILFGLGPVNYMYYWYDPTFIPRSRLEGNWYAWVDTGYALPSHNMFIDIYAQSGLIGLGLFLWGMAALVWLMYKTARRFKPGFTNAYVLGVLCGFIAMLFNSFLFADWLIPFVYNITITGFAHSVYTWLLLGSVLGIYFKLKEQPDEPAA